MAFVGPQSISSWRATNLVLTLVCCVLLMNTCHSLNNRKLSNASNANFFDGWSPAAATWYGSPYGGGTDGGACGYSNAVEQPPFSDMVSAVGPSLFQSGQGCGVCYMVKCTGNWACSGSSVIVTVTDSCPGCTSESAHFDLSGAAFGAMAKSGQGDQLRNAGYIQIQYKRVECNYHGVTLAFHVDSGSNPYYFAATIEYVDGDGDLGSVELRQDGDPWWAWHPMQELWGAVWKLNSGSELRAPFSLRLTEAVSGKTLEIKNGIPKWWQPGQTYRSVTNF